MVNKARAKERAGIIASRRVYAADRMGDYNSTTDIVDGLFDSLGSTGSGLHGNLTAQHTRQLAAIAGLKNRTNQGSTRDMSRARGFIGGNFGSAISGAAAPLLRVGDRHAEGARATMKGITRSGEVTAAGGNAVMNILQGGIKEARAAAEYQTAEALSYRAKEDAKLLADQAFQMQQMRAQAKLEFQTWKKQQDYLAKKEETDAGLKGVTQVSTSVTEWAVKMRQYAAEHAAEFGPENPLTPDVLVKAIIDGDSLLGQDQHALEVLGKLARTVRSSLVVDPNSDQLGMTVDTYSREDEASDLEALIHELYPNYKKVGKLHVLKGLNSLWSMYNTGAGAEDPTDPYSLATGYTPGTTTGVAPTGYVPGTLGGVAPTGYIPGSITS